MTPTQTIDRLEALLEKATKGEWTSGDGEYKGYVSTKHPDGPTLFRPGVNNHNGDYDADAVAALKNAAPLLLALARDGIKARNAIEDAMKPGRSDAYVAATLRQLAKEISL